MSGPKANDKAHAPETRRRQSDQSTAARGGIEYLQRTLGNRMLQRIFAPADDVDATADVGQQIRTAGTGVPLEGNVQRVLEQHLGADLSGVRVHADASADTLARSVSATAFTSGSDIFFRAGAYDPSSTSGRHTLAHEAAHVVQQASGPVAGTPADGGISLSSPDDAFERAAEATASAVHFE
ncbi:MAG: DUF4157 domain-containing protein [Chloroflexi bacterium]|nr:DUF4157 domain-containing protein [Chloroflexota bacterium]